MKNKLVLAVSLFFLVVYLSACGLKVGNLDVGKLASTGANIVSGNQLSDSEQIEIGEQMTAIIIGASRLHTDKKLQQYVNKVGRWVAKNSDNQSKQIKKTNWHFIVIDTDDFNAFSMPGGFIVISSGAIASLSSESELAAILAHEIVHIEQKHQVKAIEKSNQFSDLGTLAFLASDYHQAQKGQTWQSATNRQIAKGLFDVTQQIYTKGLGRDDELDADQKAVVLLARAGYDPYAYLTVLQIIESIDDTHKTLILATHPKALERIQVANASINSISKKLVNTKVVSERFLTSTR